MKFNRRSTSIELQMKISVTGKFNVKTAPQSTTIEHDTSLSAARLSLDKTFEGALTGRSRGEMMSIMNSDKSAGSYVAMEVFEGTLEGVSGSFALQHYGKFDSSGQSLLLEVVPGSGEGELAGISGKMSIRNEEKQHYYDLEVEV